MLRKSYFILLSAIGTILLSTMFVSAQDTISGRVEMEKEDGTKQAIEGALVRIFRVDAKSGNKSDTTDKDGAFNFVGVPSGSQYLLTVSGEGLQPIIMRTSAGVNNELVYVKSGDGLEFTEEQVRSAAEGEKLSEEELKKRDEEIAKIQARNEKTEEKNTLREKYAKEGLAAQKSGDHNTAIEIFRKGYDLDPEFLGSAPVFLNLKADSLKRRAIDNFNTAVKAKDAAMIQEAKLNMAKDFSEALEATNKSYMLAKNGKPEGSVTANTIKSGMNDAETITKEIVKVMNQASITLASNIQSEEDAENAIATYKNILEMMPKNPDVLAGLGLALYISSEFIGSDAQKQESLNYMDLYKRTAPKDHSQQEAVNELYNVLTTVNKLKPQKID